MREVVRGPLPGMSVQGPASRFNWYFVMVASAGSLQRSVTVPEPAAVAARPAGFAGRVGSAAAATVSTGERA